MKPMSTTILLTGGAGFIASHVVRLLAEKYPKYKVRNTTRPRSMGWSTNYSSIEA